MDADISLPAPRTQAGRDGLAAILEDPGRTLIALDFDGVLSPIVEDPETSRLVDGGLDALRRISAVVQGLAVITGRPAETVVRLGGLDAVPGLVVEGQYGLEQWRDGTTHVPEEPPPGISEVRAQLPAIVADSDPAVWIEDKGLALVIHTRRAEEPREAMQDLSGPVDALAQRYGLHASIGRMVLEIRKAGEDKGRTLRRIVEEVRPASVLFAGDDVGDLPAFEMIASLREDGLSGLSVAAASEEVPAVIRSADLAVDGPAGVVDLLNRIASAARS